MQRTILIAALLCACEAAVAQELTAEQRSACKGDYEKYCKGTTPGGAGSSHAFPNRATSSRQTARKSWWQQRKSKPPRPALGAYRAGYRGAVVVRRPPVVAACRRVLVNGVWVRRCV